MRKKIPYFIIAALVVALLFSLHACSVQRGAVVPEAYQNEKMYSAGTGSYNGFAAFDLDEASYDTAPTSSVKTVSPTAERSSDDLEVEIEPDKIIYSGDATLETETFEETVEAVQKMIADCGGFIESSSLSGSNYYNSRLRTASYTLRVPSSRFAEIMNSLSGFGNVPYSHTYTENISAQYYDTSARLVAYKTQEQRLLQMMEQAESVSDLVTIEEHLTELRYQIESLQSTINRWDRQVSYSSISLDIKEVKEYTPEVQESYLKQIVRAFKQGITNITEFFKAALLWFLEALPVIVLLVVLIFVVRIIMKKRKAKRQMKKVDGTSAGNA